jgi:hypothetical protein
MKKRIAKKILLAAAILFAAISSERAQQNVTGRANNFTSVEYFDPPNHKQMKMRLSGADAQPQPANNGALIIKKMKLETFNPDGSTVIIVEAPECVYDTMKGMASSPGHLQLRSGDGKLRMEGEGFLWRQSDGLLTISNDVRTVIESEPGTKTAL